MLKIVLYGITCVSAAMISLAGNKRKHAGKVYTYEMPVKFCGQELISIPIKESEKKFYKDFSGIVGSYKLKDRPGESLFIRYIEKPSRLLHPAEECYKAKGYKMKKLPDEIMVINDISNNPAAWSRFLIEEKSGDYEILQNIISLESGVNYPQIQQWFWNVAFSSKDKGPWVAFTWKKPYKEKI